MVALAIPSRPKLRRIPVPHRLPAGLTLTMSIGQWDSLLASAYVVGALLLELDGDERPVAAYRREM